MTWLLYGTQMRSSSPILYLCHDPITEGEEDKGPHQFAKEFANVFVANFQPHLLFFSLFRWKWQYLSVHPLRVIQLNWRSCNWTSQVRVLSIKAAQDEMLNFTCLFWWCRFPFFFCHSTPKGVSWRSDSLFWSSSASGYCTVSILNWKKSISLHFSPSSLHLKCACGIFVFILQ